MINLFFSYVLPLYLSMIKVLNKVNKAATPVLLFGSSDNPCEEVFLACR